MFRVDQQAKIRSSAAFMTQLPIFQIPLPSPAHPGLVSSSQPIGPGSPPPSAASPDQEFVFLRVRLADASTGVFLVGLRSVDHPQALKPLPGTALVRGDMLSSGYVFWPLPDGSTRACACYRLGKSAASHFMGGNSGGAPVLLEAARRLKAMVEKPDHKL